MYDATRLAHDPLGAGRRWGSLIHPDGMTHNNQSVNDDQTRWEDKFYTSSWGRDQTFCDTDADARTVCGS